VGLARHLLYRRTYNRHPVPSLQCSYSFPQRRVSTPRVYFRLTLNVFKGSFFFTLNVRPLGFPLLWPLFFWSAFLNGTKPTSFVSAFLPSAGSR